MSREDMRDTSTTDAGVLNVCKGFFVSTLARKSTRSVPVREKR
jgi:hypothetical protein